MLNGAASPTMLNGAASPTMLNGAASPTMLNGTASPTMRLCQPRYRSMVSTAKLGKRERRGGGHSYWLPRARKQLYYLEAETLHCSTTGECCVDKALQCC